MAVLLAPITTTGVVLILMIFILLQREDIRDRVIRLVGARDIEKTTAALNDAASRLSRLFLVQTALNLAYGAVIALGLWLIGVPSPLLWGIVATLMRFVPYVGAVLAAVFPVLLAASVDPGWTMVILTLSLYVVLEPIVGHLIEPWVHGHTTGLSPLAIVVSAVLWTALWGPIGLLLATPLTMCLVVMGRHVEGLNFLDVVLGDQPALTPPEVFYQRLLAGSSAEAAEQADIVLANTSLINYFDSVALPGLQLAAADGHRGALAQTRMSALQEGVSVLLEDLSDHPVDAAELDASPDASGDSVAPREALPVLADKNLAPAWRGEKPHVLCIGVRTPLDLAAAQILAQLITRHGVPARVASSARLSDIGQLDLDGVKLVWLSSVDAAQANAHLRFVVRRLRRAGTKFAIHGGYWDGTTSGEPSSFAVDAIANDLRGAVKMTIAIASDVTIATRSPTVAGVQGSDARLHVREGGVHG